MTSLRGGENFNTVALGHLLGQEGEASAPRLGPGKSSDLPVGVIEFRDEGQVDLFTTATLPDVRLETQGP